MAVPAQALTGSGETAAQSHEYDLTPQCVATSRPLPSNAPAITGGLYFSSIQWSPDGSCLLTNGSDHALRTFVLPPDLVDKPSVIKTLESYSTIPSPEPLSSVTTYPGYRLPDPSTTLALSSSRDHPIKLHNTLFSTLTASYPLINKSTEAYISPNSLLFAQDGTFFVAGSSNRISLFDASRPGEGPFHANQTIPTIRNKVAGGGVGMRGIVSALCANTDGLLAAGTFTRWVSLYAHHGKGERTSVFSISGEGDSEIGGNGITQTLWSPCGQYLYVVERNSDGAVLYDHRVTGKRLGYLRGRRAYTSQRMDVQIVPTDKGHEVWAGGTDGCVRVWDRPHESEGPSDPQMEWRVYQNGAVPSAVLDRSGSAMATCHGERVHGLDLEDSDSDDSSDSESSKADLESDSDRKPISPESPSDQSSDFILKVWKL